MKFRILIFFGFFLLCSACFSNAGWFGPSNFDECLLEKMKGQDQSMLKISARMCEKEFPYERELGFGYFNHIKYRWMTDINQISVEIEQNNGDYIITKIRASFSKKPYEEQPKYGFDSDITKEISIIGDKIGSFQVDDGLSYKSMQINAIYGKYRK